MNTYKYVILYALQRAFCSKTKFSCVYVLSFNRYDRLRERRIIVDTALLVECAMYFLLILILRHPTGKEETLV